VAYVEVSIEAEFETRIEVSAKFRVPEAETQENRAFLGTLKI